MAKKELEKKQEKMRRSSGKLRIIKTIKNLTIFTILNCFSASRET